MNNDNNGRQNNGQPVNYYQLPQQNLRPVVVPQQNIAVAEPKAAEEQTQPKKNSNGKLFLGIIIGVAITALIGIFVGVMAFRYANGMSHNNNTQGSAPSVQGTQPSENGNNDDKPESNQQASGDIEDIIDNLQESPVTDTTIPDDPTVKLTYAQVAEKLQPSVCTVLSYYYSTSVGGGSGIILSEDGYIVTNAHVVVDENYSDLDITVKVYGRDEEYPAEIIGYDEKSDIALLKIDTTGLVAAEIGDSNSLVVGDEVVAIGTPLDEAYAGTVTNGIISGLDRVIDDTETATKYIQTNAAINPGNSGGPLVNMYGQVIGINTAKIVMEGYEGMGFAIPMDSILDIITQLQTVGYIERPALGIMCQTVTESEALYYDIPQGVRIVSVAGNSDLAGKVENNDIITAIDGEEIKSVGDLTLVLDSHKIGDELELTMYRQKSSQTGSAKTYTVKVILGSDAVISHED